MTKLLLSDYIKVYERTLTPDRCQALIDRFEASSDQHAVMDHEGSYSFVQLDVAKAWPDIDLQVSHIMMRCFGHYQEALGLRQRWPATYFQEPLRLKRYLPNSRDGFLPHVDVMDTSTADRFITAIIYLNDPVGGETVFPDFGVTVRPEPGRMVVFPPLWPFLHAGMPPRDRPKYILHAYLLYPPPGTGEASAV